MDELTLTYLGIGLVIAGIIATIIVAVLVYKLQKRESKATKGILDIINEITENQANTIESLINDLKTYQVVDTKCRSCPSKSYRVIVNLLTELQSIKLPDLKPT